MLLHPFSIAKKSGIVPLDFKRSTRWQTTRMVTINLAMILDGWVSGVGNVEKP